MSAFLDLPQWMLTEGRFEATLEGLFGKAIARIEGAGLPLLRCGLHIPVLHPQLLAVSVHWWRGRPIERVDRPRVADWESAGFNTSPMAVVRRTGLPVRPDVASDQFPILADLRAQGATDYYVQPLIFSDRNVGGTVTWCTDRPGGFSASEIEGLDTLAQALALVCELRTLRGLTSTLLDTYIGRTAGRRVLAGTIERGSGELLEAVVWYCDLRNFTARSEAGPQSAVISLLNDYFEAMAGAVQAQGGEVLKFIGDAMLAIFPIEGDEGAACRAALTAARAAAERMAELDQRVRAAGGAPVGYGVALHLGAVTYGNIGAPDRLDFTVIGPAVNQASRVEGLCRDLGRSFLMTTAVAAHVPDGVELLGSFALRGIDEPQQIWGLAGERTATH